ncbi:MAG: shikimate kinase [Betaproteobacteria bacterium]|nr:shikimate kinase [Betaproteobacteria bacterium]
MSEPRSIALIGMMGAGKSTLAPLVAAELKLDWIDIDAQIEARLGKSIVSIFAEDGKEHFRDLESEQLAQSLAKSPAVIATGGGCVLRTKNRDLLAGCRCAYLELPDHELIRRIGDGGNRPLLDANQLSDQISQLLAERTSIYRQLADCTVRIDKPEAPQDTCRRIVAALA